MVLFIIILLVAAASADSPSQRIVNGVEATRHAYPSQLSLQRYNSHICGAVLVNSNYAITAAHCVDGATARQFRIQCGAHNITASESFRQTAAVSAIKMHPQYNIYGGRPAFANDIAVLQLASPVQFTRECQPAHLPSGSYDYANRAAMITGWGRIYGNGRLANVLKEGSVDVLSPQQCHDNYWGPTVHNNYHICVKDLGDKIYGGCNGDSGGPVHVGNTVVGLASFVSGACYTMYPTVYVRISNYRLWISNTMASMG